MINQQEQSIAAEEAEIEETVRAWRAHYETLLADDDVFEAFCAEQLKTDAAAIVDLARLGHPAADRALRRHIISAIDAGRFQELPPSVRAYASEAVPLLK